MKQRTYWLRYLILILALCLVTACAPTRSPIENCPHVDADDNGHCDDCGISVIVFLDLYAINDLHGKFADGDSHPGVDEMTSYLKWAMEGDDYALLLSSGDTWQGSSESNLTQGLILTDWMNALDFACMTLGNHEYDWGAEAIEQNAEAAEFPFLGINIFDRTTGERVEYCQPSVLVEAGPLTVGIIGAIGDCYSSISSDKTQDIYFKTGAELTALVKAESERLRALGADLIVYSLHDGYDKSSYDGVNVISSSKMSSYYDVALSDGYVDLVFEGHTHQRYVLKDAHGVYHLQNGGDNKGLCHVEIAVNFVSGSRSVTVGEFIPADRYTALADDPIVETLLEKYSEQISLGQRVVGQNAVARDGNTLRQLVARLYYEFGVQQWGDQYDIVLGGGFLSVRSPGRLVTGEITYAQLMGIFPFDNQLTLCSVYGRDLDRKFFNTSNSNYFIYYEDYGQAVEQAIDPNAVYYIIVDSYTSSYAPNRLTVVEQYDEDFFARDLLAAYIEAGGLSKP